MKPTGHYGIPIFKAENRGCEWCVSAKRSEAFPVCRNPESIYSLFPLHTFILGCPTELNGCQFFRRQSKKMKRYDTVGKYLDKYSDSGFILIPDQHFEALAEKFGTTKHRIQIIIRSYGWYPIKKDAKMGKGNLYTNIQNRDMQRQISNDAKEAKA